MKEIATQLLFIWKGIKPLQKAGMLAILVFLCVILGCLIFRSRNTSYVPLDISTWEPKSVQNYLGSHHIPFKEHSEKGIFVPEDQVDRIHRDLAIPNYLRGDQGKGFELFDTNTWIKGEKELQVLEMRALKGQLEKDLAGFDQIKDASVILDIPPVRNFVGAQYKTKASVILTLMPQVRLSSSQLRAITYHLTGAVRGLEWNMIAISDTKGRLYKAMDPEGKDNFMNDTCVIFEEHLEEKISAFLTAVVGKDHFFSTIEAQGEKSGNKPHYLSMTVLVDKHYEDLVERIKEQIDRIVSGYEIPFSLVVDAIVFEKKKGLWIETKGSGSYGWVVLACCIFFLLLFSLFLLFRYDSKKKYENSIFQVMTRVDVDKLAKSIQEEDPKKIALMLSYLEPMRAEELIASFPQQLQEKVFFYLNELEREV